MMNEDKRMMNEDKRRRLVAHGEDLERAIRYLEGCGEYVEGYEPIRALIDIASQQLDLGDVPPDDFHRREALLSHVFVKRMEVAKLLLDPEGPIAAATETAFAHLNRLLTVDKELQERWRKAYDGAGEVSCEKLGAVHLLHHGLWAFKVNAEGQRTDLVYNEKPYEIGEPLKAARGLIITEWKRLEGVESKTKTGQPRSVEVQRRMEKGELDTKTEAASRQLQEYTEGVLRDTELRSTRYVVVVSMKKIPDFPDRDGCVRYINVTIDRDSPSQTV